jgi:hypothetical protein
MPEKSNIKNNTNHPFHEILVELEGTLQGVETGYRDAISHAEYFRLQEIYLKKKKKKHKKKKT